MMGSELEAMSPRGRQLIQRRAWLGVKLPNGHRWLPGTQGRKWWAMVDERGDAVVMLQASEWSGWEPRVGVNGLPTRDQPGYPGGTGWETRGCFPGLPVAGHNSLIDAVNYAAGLAAWWSGAGPYPARSNPQTPQGRGR